MNVDDADACWMSCAGSDVAADCGVVNSRSCNPASSKARPAGQSHMQDETDGLGVTYHQYERSSVICDLYTQVCESMARSPPASSSKGRPRSTLDDDDIDIGSK